MTLLTAGDKYNVQFLIEKCLISIWNNISIVNAVEVLTLANLHQQENLCDLIIDFIANDFEKIGHTEDWVEFKELNPHLPNKVFEKTIRKLSRRRTDYD